MNAVLQYAIDHRAEACRFLCGRYGVPLDDVEDVVQTALLNILKLDPENLNPRAYWRMALQSAAINSYRRRRVRPETVALLYEGIPDPRQELETVVECREEVRRAWREATPGGRRAIMTVLMSREGRLSSVVKAQISKLRRRLAATA